MRFPLIHRVFICSTVIIGGVGSLFAQAESPKPVAHVAFRNDQVAIQSIQVPQSTKALSAQEGQKEAEDLSEQKQTLESELRYSKAKLDTARKKLAIESAINSSSEGLDKAQQDVRDWEARVKTLQSQLDQVDNEIQASSKATQGSGPDEGLILPGENLEVFVVEDSSFNGRYPVRRGGYIILPAIGRINVAGKDLQAAEGAVKKALESSQLHHASVMIEKVEGADVESGPVIYLAGEFKNPRPFRIPAGTKSTLVSVILSSGGVTDRADLTRVKVMRVAANKGVVDEVNVEKILAGGGLTSDLALNEGDVVVVPGGTANTIFVTGNVKRQGAQVLKLGEKLNAYDSILQSGGFARFADIKKVYVLRASPDGTKIKIPVNIAAIQKGQAPDVPLLSNDIVVVPEKFFSF
ncbi:MAG: SLBB domain-containing protein [Verrucomicrobiota bacterium]